MGELFFSIALLIIFIVVVCKKKFNNHIILKDDSFKKTVTIINNDNLKNMSQEEARHYLLSKMQNNDIDIENVLDSQQKLDKGDVKVIRSVKKTVTKYSNGEKVSEAQTITTDNIDKKAVSECPNCGASLDLKQDFCSYCRTKIN